MDEDDFQELFEYIGAEPKRYHTACFTCKVCGEVFEEKEGGHAVFVRVEEGACHVRVSLTFLFVFEIWYQVLMIIGE